MTLFLFVVAALCFAVRDWVTGCVVVSLVVLHSAVFVHEDTQMQVSAEALRAFLVTNATVKRSGEWVTVTSSQVVPGDLVKLKVGDVVPADCVLQAGKAVEVDQSVITGESIPVVRCR